MTAAAVYVRVSTAQQSDTGASLVTQEQACRDYAAAHGLTVVAVFSDVHTGVELWERPRLTALREAMKRREVDIVIAHAIDRLARDPVHLGVILTEAEHAGVDVQFVTEPLDHSPEGQLIRFVRGYAAKIEHAKIRERTMRGKLARVTSGKLHSHGPELYGYRRDKDAGRRTIHEAEAAVVREIFALADDGMSIRAIVRRLNAAGVPPPSAGKSARPGAVWGRSQVHRVLTHPAYRGETIAWRYNDTAEATLPAGTTPAIVDADAWDRVQVRQPRGADVRNERLPFLLRGHIFCGRCGKRMYAENEKRTRRVYRCSSRETRACGAGRSPADEIEADVWDEIVRVLDRPEIVREELAHHADGADVTLIERRITDAERELRRKDAQAERLMRQYREADGGVPWALVAREIAAIEREKAATGERLDRLRAELAQRAALTQQAAGVEAFCALWSGRLRDADFALKRDALAALDVQVLAEGRRWELSWLFPNTGVLSA